jgi:uncharacterized protein (DUF433 family)
MMARRPSPSPVTFPGTSTAPGPIALGRRPPPRRRHTPAIPFGVPSRSKERLLDRTDARFAKPLYTVTEASSYLGVPRSTFETWVRGYTRHPAGRRVVRGSAMVTSVSGGRLTIPFVGLAEGMVLAAFRETGLPLQRIRPALECLEAEVGLEHALASRHLYTDGAELLFDYARSQGDEQLGLLTVVRSGLRVFHDVIDRYLQRIEYDAGWAARVMLPITDEPLLVADPKRAFGQPIFIHGGARLADVIGRIEAGENEGVVAEDFSVPLEDVRALLPPKTATPPEFFVDRSLGRRV